MFSFNRKITHSMSRKGNCWGNTLAKSIFKLLKTELLYCNKRIAKEQMKLDIFEYIEIWCHKKRRHSTLNDKTIEEFNKQKCNFKKVD